MPLLGKSSSWASQLEGPEEVVGLFEMRTHSVDFINQILNGVDSVLGKIGINESVVGQRYSLVVDFAVSSLVNEFSYGLSGGITMLNKMYPKVI